MNSILTPKRTWGAGLAAGSMAAQQPTSLAAPPSSVFRAARMSVQEEEGKKGVRSHESHESARCKPFPPLSYKCRRPLEARTRTTCPHSAGKLTSASNVHTARTTVMPPWMPNHAQGLMPSRS